MSTKEHERWENLRRRAEAAVVRGDEGGEPLTAEEASLLIQELQVVQAELELQNEELRETQVVLDGARRRFQTLFEQAPVGYVVLDEVGMIRSANEQFRQFVGADEAKVRAQSLRGFVASDARDAFDRRFQVLTLGGSDHRLDTILVNQADGDRLNVRLEGSRIAGLEGGQESGEPMILVAVSDLTRARDLEMQLWESQKLQTAGRLAGGVAHDFNNVLTVITGTVEVARDEVAPDSPLLEYFDQIRDAAGRAAALVRQLLAFANEQVVSPRVVDLAAVTAPQVAMLRRLLPESAEFRVEMDPHLHPVHIDPVQVDQILTNLVLNARDALGTQGRIRLALRNEVLDAEHCRGFPGTVPGAYVAVSVQDDGSGMTAAVREKVFEPFFTTKAEGKGAGLGLSTVYGIVTQNHGLVHISSRPGEGTTVTVHLPRTTLESSGVEATLAPVELLEGREHVMVVEDDPIVLRLAARMLVRRGYRVTPFGSAVDALAWFDQGGAQVDLVLTDVVMPEMRGPTLVEHLLEIRPDLPHVFMTGHPKDEPLPLGSGLADAADIITKPFDSVTLLSTVRGALSRPRI
ncbi:response regulator [bacterium]|nr:response regulator [bacterium]